MLELELQLVPFVRDCFETLSEAEQSAYVELLEEEDWQIFDWLQGRVQPTTNTMQVLIAKISAHRGKL